MIRALLVLLVWAVQATLICLLVTDGWVEREFSEERSLVASELGSQRANALAGRAERAYRRWFVDNGRVAGSYATVLPDHTVPQQGMENLAPWAFRWAGHRLDAFWWLAYQAVYRLFLLGVWFPYVAVASGAALIDGLVRRQIKRANSGYASGDRIAIARAGLLVLLLGPLFYLSLPIAVPPMMLPLGGAGLALLCSLYAANIQHRI